MREARYTLVVVAEEIGKSLWPLEDGEIGSDLDSFSGTKIFVAKNYR